MGDLLPESAASRRTVAVCCLTAGDPGHGPVLPNPQSPSRSCRDHRWATIEGAAASQRPRNRPLSPQRQRHAGHARPPVGWPRAQARQPAPARSAVRDSGSPAARRPLERSPIDHLDRNETGAGVLRTGTIMRPRARGGTATSVEAAGRIVRVRASRCGSERRFLYCRGRPRERPDLGGSAGGPGPYGGRARAGRRGRARAGQTCHMRKAPREEWSMRCWYWYLPRRRESARRRRRCTVSIASRVRSFSYGPALVLVPAAAERRQGAAESTGDSDRAAESRPGGPDSDGRRSTATRIGGGTKRLG